MLAENPWLVDDNADVAVAEPEAAAEDLAKKESKKRRKDKDKGKEKEVLAIQDAPGSSVATTTEAIDAVPAAPKPLLAKQPFPTAPPTLPGRPRSSAATKEAIVAVQAAPKPAAARPAPSPSPSPRRSQDSASDKDQANTGSSDAESSESGSSSVSSITHADCELAEAREEELERCAAAEAAARARVQAEAAAESAAAETALALQKADRQAERQSRKDARRTRSRTAAQQRQLAAEKECQALQEHYNKQVTAQLAKAKIRSDAALEESERRHQAETDKLRDELHQMQASLRASEERTEAALAQQREKTEETVLAQQLQADDSPSSENDAPQLQTVDISPAAKNREVLKS